MGLCKGSMIMWYFGMNQYSPNKIKQRRPPLIQFIFIFGSLLIVGLISIVNSANAITRSNTEHHASDFTQLNLYPNIETVGVVVSGDTLPSSAHLIYRKSGESIWHSGHPLILIDDGRLVGSLFDLDPETSYEIKVIDGGSEISGTITTQPDELLFTPSATLYVDDDAPPGGNGSQAMPFQTIQAGVSNAGPGTQVLVADGIYHEKVSFSKSGSENNWIQVKAEGNGAILDGSEHLSGDIWTPHASELNVWFTNIGESTWYLGRDQERYYRFDDLGKLLSGNGHNNVPMDEGWFIEPGESTLYVRSLDDPANHTWQVPRFNHAFDVDARDWLWFEGFEIRFYGKEDGRGFYLENTSHVVIRHNKIHHLSEGILINWTGGAERGNDIRIEYNEFYDSPVNEWPWKAVKGTSMEGSAIKAGSHIGTIIRNNEVHHIFNGIYTGRWNDLENRDIAFDTDIYDNNIHHIGDDGLEPEGASINQRFRNNVVDTMLVGISFAPVTYGPVWVIRSQFTNFSGTSIKWDTNSDGKIFIYHNTSWTDEDSLNAMTFRGPSHNSVMRNNIFQGTRYAFEASSTGNNGHDWDYDNWYTTRETNDPYFKWENVTYNNISELCSATGLECNGHEAIPGFTDPDNGDFTLLPWSLNINRGILIPGVNDDYMSEAPDNGAYESNHPSPMKLFLPVVLKSNS